MGKFGDAIDRSMAAMQLSNGSQQKAAHKAADERAAKLKVREDWLNTVFHPVCEEVNQDLKTRGAQLLTRSVEQFAGLTITATVTSPGKPPSQAIIKVDNNADIQFEGRPIGPGREPLEDALVEFLERTFGGSSRLSIPD